MCMTCGFWKLRSLKVPGRQDLVQSAGAEVAGVLCRAGHRVLQNSWSMADTDELSFSSLLLAACLCQLCWTWCGVKLTRTFVWHPQSLTALFFSLWGGTLSWYWAMLAWVMGQHRPKEAILPHTLYPHPHLILLYSSLLLKFLVDSRALAELFFVRGSWFNHWSLCRDRCWGNSYLAILLMLLCRSQVHISFVLNFLYFFNYCWHSIFFRCIA